jgi:hypothetical protein
MSIPANTLAISIDRYFAGERTEMFWILGICAIVSLLVLGLWWVQRDGFSKSFAGVVMAGVLILTSVAVGILMRDPAHQAKLQTEVAAPAQRAAALQTESQRMVKVIAAYPSYRYTFMALAIVALIAAFIWPLGWVNGLAAGFCVLFMALSVVDHYSEARAQIYLKQLQTTPR